MNYVLTLCVLWTFAMVLRPSVEDSKLPAITEENSVRGDHREDFEEEKAPQVLSHRMRSDQEIDQSCERF